MGYLHIANLYKDQRVLLFRECWALEKIHGTSAHISFSRTSTGGVAVSFSPGGEDAARFRALFDADKLLAAYSALGAPDLVVYGEAYGGRQQGQSWRYGKELCFVAFDVRIVEWQDVPAAHALVISLGLEFVHYARVSTDLSALDAERDAPSAQSTRNGVEGGPHRREGVVLRPLHEAVIGGERVIAKHKRDEERETKSPRQVVSAERTKLLEDAQSIADEWVTEMRLTHVLQRVAAAKAGTTLGPVGMEDAGKVIAVMVEDVLREGAGELVDSREARAAIGRQTALLLRRRLDLALREDS
jgi:hypothetical protein